MEQAIHYTASADGARIAYAALGSGPPLVKTANWLNHLEFDLHSPVWRHWLRELSRDHCLIRYDERGCGLSDRDTSSAGLDAWVGDLEAVVDALGLERFPLLGISQGGPVAIAYAVRHPARVTQLILYGTYARGWARQNAPQQELDERDAMLTLTRVGWGRDLPAYREPFTQTFIPGATDEQRDWFNELQRISCSPDGAVALQRAMGEMDVEDLLSRVTAPTLVLHARGDLRCSFVEGQWLAERIPHSRFVPLEGSNHLLLENEEAWPRFLHEVRAFMGVSTAPSTPVDPMRESLERSLGGGYSVSRELGGGGMSRVFVAADARLDREIVVKVFAGEGAEGLSADRFTREMKLAASLQHPNIVAVLAAGMTKGGVPYYTMPFIRGESLGERLPWTSSTDEALAVLHDVAAALEYAHSAGIVHRDIKPGNILLSDRAAMVADFGIAKALAELSATPPNRPLTMAGTSLGTPAYMAPEQVAGDAVDARADVYAWGMVAYELLAGAHPFAEKKSAQQLMTAQILEVPAPIGEKTSALPPEITTLIMRCLEKDPERRPAAGGDIRRILTAASHNLSG